MNEILANYPREPPVLQPPQFKKEAVYENNMAVFEVLDETSKNAAKDNWKTFTKLVRHLVGRCSSDVDKARAIFRFISKTLPSSSNSLALSRGKPSVSSKPAPLLHARPSRLHLSPSASSQLLSLSGSSLPLSSSSASSQHRALPRGDQRLPGLQLRPPGGSRSQEV